MSVRRVRGGELLALLGGICVIVSLFVVSYHDSFGTLTAWDTFGPAVALTIAAAFAGLAVAASALTEQAPALPISAAVWSVLVGLIGVIAAIVRVLERPEHATSLGAGAWLALAGTLAIFAGSWLTLRDEHASLYDPLQPPARPAP